MKAVRAARAAGIAPVVAAENEPYVDDTTKRLMKQWQYYREHVKGKAPKRKGALRRLRAVAYAKNRWLVGLSGQLAY
jgi:hypothetical protein